MTYTYLSFNICAMFSCLIHFFTHGFGCGYLYLACVCAFLGCCSFVSHDYNCGTKGIGPRHCLHAVDLDGIDSVWMFAKL